MKIFGKTLGEYIHFQRVILALILVVGLVRFVLSLAGVPNDTVRWLSMTVIALIGIIYYGIRVHTARFGSYKQLLPLLVNQHVLAHGIAIIGIVWAIATGQGNIFSAPEYSGGQEGGNWIHVIAHVGVGMIALSLVGWLLASGIMWVTKKVAPGEGTAAAASA